MFTDKNQQAIYESFLGKTIRTIDLKNNELFLYFTDNTACVLTDSACYCCEERYTSTDDNLQDYVSGVLLEIEVRNWAQSDNDNDVQFVVIKTSKEPFTLVNHNNHNGYYAGFELTIDANVDMSSEPIGPKNKVKRLRKRN